MTASQAGIVVVGGGLAGLRTVEELRALGYPGSVTLIGAERRRPYDRPPLSKQLLAGAVDDTSLRAELGSLGAEIRLGERADRLADGVLGTDRGEYSFDRLVIATGARPVALPGPAAGSGSRTIDDALALRETLVPGARLAVIVGWHSGGWIGRNWPPQPRGLPGARCRGGQRSLAGAVGTGELAR
jgi:3-phenylpropionate/trans-cinnamate dioxygenase ferredoxin reductase subunit